MPKAINQKLLDAVRQKLGVSRPTLYRRITERRRELLCGAPEALYTIAFDQGFDLAAYLTSEEIEAVRPFVSARRKSQPRPEGKSSEHARSSRSGAAPKPALVSIGGITVERLPGMPARTAREAKTMAKKVYPTIYVFENSARALITALMEAQFGKSWWDEKVPRKVRDAAAGRKADEQKDPWHGRRGTSMIDYTLLSELPAIVNANDAWPLFKPIFQRKSFFEELVNDINVSRRAIAHMNPVSSEDVKHVEAAFRKWAKTLKAKKDLLP
jgi:hypothetical protein